MSNLFTWNYDLFPTKWSAAVFVAYMALFINQGILITATKTTDSTYNYNTTEVVLLTECVKLIVSCILFIRDHSGKQLLQDIYGNVKVLGLYSVPASLYCLYNNLAFINLSAFDPTTYYLLLQFRVVITGVFFQLLFKKHLNVKQWFSLLLLTLGCIIKELPSNFYLGGLVIPRFTFNLPLILLQAFCSCFAGVYNEYLLKHTAVGVHIMLQNIFLYIDSIVCNIGVLWAQGQLLDTFDSASFKQILQWKVLGIIVNNAAIGIVTSIFLNSLNSILKTFASAMELMFTAIICWFLFGIPVDSKTVIAIILVTLAIYLYAQNPVINKPKHIPVPPKSVGSQSTELPLLHQKTSTESI